MKTTQLYCYWSWYDAYGNRSFHLERELAELANIDLRILMIYCINKIVFTFVFTFISRTTAQLQANSPRAWLEELLPSQQNIIANFCCAISFQSARRFLISTIIHQGELTNLWYLSHLRQSQWKALWKMQERHLLFPQMSRKWLGNTQSALLNVFKTQNLPITTKYQSLPRRHLSCGSQSATNFCLARCSSHRRWPTDEEKPWSLRMVFR